MSPGVRSASSARSARLIVSADGEARLTAAREWLAAQPRAAEILIVGPSWEACDDLVRAAATDAGARFGTSRLTLDRLAASLAAPALALAGRLPASGLALAAVAARAAHGLLAEGALPYFSPVAGRPGFPAAIVRTLEELRMNGVAGRSLQTLPDGGPDIAALAARIERELEDAGLTDRAAVYAAAVEAAERIGKAGGLGGKTLGKPARGKGRPAGSESRIRDANHEGDPRAESPGIVMEGCIGASLLLLDVPVNSRSEAALIAALARGAPHMLATAAAGDTGTLERLERAVGVRAERLHPPAQGPLPAAAGESGPIERSERAIGRRARTLSRAAEALDPAAAATAPAATAPAATAPAATAPAATDPAATAPAATDPSAIAPAATTPAATDPLVLPSSPLGASLAALKAHLFEETTPPEAGLDASVTLRSWPGVARECVEIARGIQAEAARGVPFDRIAIFLRSPGEYRPHVEEALQRAEIPAYFARGTTRPDPAGRALLALLACAAEKLSARRFAEYVSLAQVPDPGAPRDPDRSWAPPEGDLLPVGGSGAGGWGPGNGRARGGVEEGAEQEMLHADTSAAGAGTEAGRDRAASQSRARAEAHAAQEGASGEKAVSQGAERAAPGTGAGPMRPGVQAPGAEEGAPGEGAEPGSEDGASGEGAEAAALLTAARVLPAGANAPGSEEGASGEGAGSRRSEPATPAAGAASTHSAAAPGAAAGATPSGRSAAAAAPVSAGTLRAPWRWERLLVEAAVIGGQERWVRRLDGLEQELRVRRQELGDEDEARAARLDRQSADLAHLRASALPLIARLAALPGKASWGEWLAHLRALAAAALREPAGVLATLAELEPMAPVGPVDLDEVQIVLAPRLRDLMLPPPRRRYGAVFVAAAEAARGLAFEVVFVPGLAEKLFPRKIVEDPILLDEPRRLLEASMAMQDGLPSLASQSTRAAAERLMLRLAVGAARARLVLSYPRVDVEQARARVPSFYGLEALRAAEGKLPGFDELGARAGPGSAARLGWPAPERPVDAIDEAEYDLALLAPLLDADAATLTGTATYLLSANVHLGRALRARARRWLRRWTPADGLVDPEPLARAALARHQLDARAFSPTALQNFAACPYRFFLQAIHRLAPLEEAEAIEVLDPLTRGALFHDVQFEVLTRLREQGLLPVVLARLEAAIAEVDGALDRVAAGYKEKLAPAIERVWDDAMGTLRADLREWLRRGAEREDGWVPHRFELAFGLAGRDRPHADPASVPEPVTIVGGLRLRGSIDLVERHARGTLRATDHKTGKARAKAEVVVGGGEVLQPVLYALAVEKLLNEPVESGRLYYCTADGGYEERIVPLDDESRASAATVVAILGEALAIGFLPAAPAPRACQWCDYRTVCGPYEEIRIARKPPERLAALKRLRGLA